MDFHVSLEGRGDLTACIYRELRAAVIDGRLRPGEHLPGTRELARSLVVSRNTVAAAYERLTAEGFLTARVGSGRLWHSTFHSGSPSHSASARRPMGCDRGRGGTSPPLR